MKTIYKTCLVSVIFSLITVNLFAQTLTSEEIYKKVSGSVLYCTSYNFDGYIESWGSAVVINPEGIVYTCFHLFENAEKIILEKDGVIFNDVKIIGTEPERDILILKIDAGNYPEMKIGNSDSLIIGEEVYALGNPQCYKNTFSKGIISAIRNDDTDLENTQIQYTASTSNGSSGGAVFNSEAELIGISYQMDTGGQDINFAIPVNYFKVVNLVDYYDSNQVNAVTAYCKGYSCYKTGGYFKANEYFNEYLELFPENNNALLQSGENYLSRGQYDSAIARYCEVISKDPLNKYAYKSRADANSFNGDTLKPLDDYSKAIEIDNKYYSAWIGRALFNRYTLKKYDDAIADYDMAISLKPQYIFLFKYRGELYLEKGDTDKAILDLTYSINPDLDIAETCYDRGRIFSELERNFEAISDFTSAIKQDPFNPDYYFSRAIEYSKTGDFINAISDYNEAIRLQFPGASVFNNLAYSHLALKEYEDAEKNFNRSLYFDKYHFDSYLGLAVIAFEMKEKKDCLNYIKKAAEIQPLIKKGIKGIIKLETMGYFWSREEKLLFNKIFKMSGYKYNEYEICTDGNSHKKAKHR